MRTTDHASFEADILEWDEKLDFLQPNPAEKALIVSIWTHHANADDSECIYISHEKFSLGCPTYNIQESSVKKFIKPECWKKKFKSNLNFKLVVQFIF